MIKLSAPDGLYCRSTDFIVSKHRPATTTAMMYAVDKKHGDPAKKGRFYWMALGAFASLSFVDQPQKESPIENSE